VDFSQIAAATVASSKARPSLGFLIQEIPEGPVGFYARPEIHIILKASEGEDGHRPFY
jgi:hypothetical protein